MYQQPLLIGNVPGKGAFKTQHISAAIHREWPLTFPSSRLSHRDRGSHSPAQPDSIYSILFYIFCVLMWAVDSLKHMVILGPPFSWHSLKNPRALCHSSHSTIFQVTSASPQWPWHVLSLAVMIAQEVGICRSDWGFGRQSLFLALSLGLGGHLGGISSPLLALVPSYAGRAI